MGARVMIVQKLCQLLAQAFVALAFVTEHHRPLEQRVLQIMREFAPEIGGRSAEDQKITRRIFIGGRFVPMASTWSSSGRFHKT